MKQFNAIVIGCGRIGKMHVENILADFPNVTIRAIVDNQLDKSWAKAHGIERVLAKDELANLLEDKTINVAIIAASSSEHVQLIKQVAAAGIDMFCEKPIGFSVEQIQQAIDAVEQYKVKLQVGLNRRFDPDFGYVKQCIVDGVIGEPHIIKITNRDPKRPDLDFIPHSGGLFLDFNVHDFDMARFLSQREVKQVFAMGAVLVDEKIAELNDIDTAIISLKLDNDALCIIDSSRETSYGYDQRVEVFGSKGNIAANNVTATRTQFLGADGALSEKPLYSFVERYRQAYRLQLKDFFDCLLADAEPAVTAYDVQKAVAIAVAAKQSLETNNPVTV